MSPLEQKMAELRARFLADAAERADALEQLTASGDFEAGRAIAHGLAGRAGMFGFDEIGALALAAEEAAPAELPARLDELQRGLRSLAQER